MYGLEVALAKLLRPRLAAIVRASAETLQK